MLYRSLLALYTALCLLVGLTALPSGPQLVCRMTGQPMPLVVAQSAASHRPCCDVSVSREADGRAHYALTHPGCCDLRQGFQRADTPVAKVASLQMPMATIATVSRLPLLPAFVAAPLRVAVPRESSPRPPPQWSPDSPRPPPVS